MDKIGLCRKCYSDNNRGELIETEISECGGIQEEDDDEINREQELRGFSCSEIAKRIVKKRLPILTWLPKYKKSFIVSDIIAAITVWLVAIPQTIAYAFIAGLPPQYGLYSHLVGPFLYTFLGSCRPVTLGPVALIALLTYQTCGDQFPECVILLSFYSGVIEFLLGLLHLGIIISFISEPVTLGFTAGAALTIASSQVKNLLAFSGKASGSGFYPAWKHIFSKIGTIQLGDTVLGVSSILFLVFFQKLNKFSPPRNLGNPNTWKKIINVLSLSRNALIVFISSVVAFLWINPPFRTTGPVQSGLPPVQLPTFELIDPHSNSTVPMTFIETIKFLKTSPIVIAFIAILQNVAITKVFGAGQTIDATQEMIALGSTNIVGSFFSSMAVSASFTRSAVNNTSGVKSQLSGLGVTTLILLSLALLTPAFQFIPKASLAGVVICAVISMIEFDTICLIWKASKMDFLCCILTFLFCLLLGMEYGMLSGICLSALIILIRSLRPSISKVFLTDEKTRLKYILLEPDQGLYYPSVDYIRDVVNKLAMTYVNYPVIVIQCDKLKSDFTSANAISLLAKNLGKHNKTLILYKNGPNWPKILQHFDPESPYCCVTTRELQERFYELKRQKDYNTITTTNSGILNNTNSAVDTLEPTDEDQSMASSSLLTNVSIQNNTHHNSDTTIRDSQENYNQNGSKSHGNV